MNGKYHDDVGFLNWYPMASLSLTFTILWRSSWYCFLNETQCYLPRQIVLSDAFHYFNPFTVMVIYDHKSNVKYYDWS